MNASDLPTNLAELAGDDDDKPGALVAPEPQPAPVAKAPRKAKAKAKAKAPEAEPDTAPVVLEEPKRPAKAKTVKIHLEDNENIPPTGLFVSHNGKGYLIPSGRDCEVPDFVVEILQHAVMSMPIVDPQTQQVVAYRDRMRYPFRRL